MPISPLELTLAAVVLLALAGGAIIAFGRSPRFDFLGVALTFMAWALLSRLLAQAP